MNSSDRETSDIHFYDGRGTAQALFKVSTIHNQPVNLMAYNPLEHTVVSIDAGGMVEYWVPDKSEEFGLPSNGAIDWKFKSDTDLYEFKKVLILLISNS
jgi:peptidylprolyl isomerase domain and WD repeat-containing protein 1